MNALLLDTGVIVAALDRSERFHRACADAITASTSPLVTCEAVIAESCYLLRKVKGAAEAVLENVAAGIFQVPFSLSESASEVRHILRKYRDSEIDLADACLIHIATELRTPDILTLDSDFHHYRWGRNNAFRMLISAASK